MGIRVDIETEDRFLSFDLIESKECTSNKKYFLENGLIITPKPRIMTKSLDLINLEFVSIVIEIAKTMTYGVIASLIANWLWDKIKNKPIKKITINKREVKISKEDIEIVIKEELYKSEEK